MDAFETKKAKIRAACGLDWIPSYIDVPDRSALPVNSATVDDMAFAYIELRYRIDELYKRRGQIELLKTDTKRLADSFGVDLDTVTEMLDAIEERLKEQTFALTDDLKAIQTIHDKARAVGAFGADNAFDALIKASK